jgi:hypothetical protein
LRCDAFGSLRSHQRLRVLSQPVDEWVESQFFDTFSMLMLKYFTHFTRLPCSFFRFRDFNHCLYKGFSFNEQAINKYPKTFFRCKIRVIPASSKYHPDGYCNQNLINIILLISTILFDFALSFNKY